jgi:hypothetical protein
MIEGQTTRSAGYQGRAPINKDVARYFVYRLSDAAGRCLYIGRSYNPAARLLQHIQQTQWARQVAEIDAWGPYAWGASIRHEREFIASERPPHNVTYTEPSPVKGEVPDFRKRRRRRT